MLYHVTYLSDGLQVKGYLCIPPDYSLTVQELEQLVHEHYQTTDLSVTLLASSLVKQKRPLSGQKLPAFIYCRGGIGRVGRVKPDWVAQFAAEGAVVFAPAYRGNEGGAGRDEFGGAENEDVRAAYRLLGSLPFVQKDRISIMGFSRGAINATQTAVQLPDIHSLILWGGVSDLAQTYEERVDLRRMLKRVLGGSPNKVPDAYIARSPLQLAAHLHCPILIMHGTADAQVAYSHGQRMYERLKQLQKDVTLHCFEGLGHHLPASIHHEAIHNMFSWMQDVKKRLP